MERENDPPLSSSSSSSYNIRKRKSIDYKPESSPSSSSNDGYEKFDCLLKSKTIKIVDDSESASLIDIDSTGKTNTPLPQIIEQTFSPNVNIYSFILSIQFCFIHLFQIIK